jgi:hypothetical protein
MREIFSTMLKDKDYPEGGGSKLLLNSSNKLQFTQCHIPEECNDQQCCENHKLQNPNRSHFTFIRAPN